MADDLAQSGEWQQGCDHRDLIDVDDPDHVRGRRIEIGGNRRKRDIGNGGGERGPCERPGERQNRGSPSVPGGSFAEIASIPRSVLKPVLGRCDRPCLVQTGPALHWRGCMRNMQKPGNPW
mgnify:CR=1 FL=1